MNVAYETDKGIFFQGNAEDILSSAVAEAYRHKVDLIFTSPPFPLNAKKKYGNLRGEEYVDWVASFAPVFKDFLAPRGSVVIEVGNAWEEGRPVMSTLALRALIEFLDRGEYQLCQQFIYYNPARLPTPAPWVTIKRIRVKDAHTHLWWMAATDRPKADNRRVLKPYSRDMKRLLRSGKYNAGRRPSDHNIGDKSFLHDNGGAIPPSVITHANTRSSTDYLRYCRQHKLRPHPARMPPEVAEFFINFLTEPGDLVLDPFAGSNTTGAVAERLGRRWVAIEPEDEYIETSRGRFPALFLVDKE